MSETGERPQTDPARSNLTEEHACHGHGTGECDGCRTGNPCPACQARNALRLATGAKRLLILADSGGSNGCRPRLFKKMLQEKLADEFGIAVTVCHYPTGASKWNPVEHPVVRADQRELVGSAAAVARADGGADPGYAQRERSARRCVREFADVCEGEEGNGPGDEIAADYAS